MKASHIPFRELRQLKHNLYCLALFKAATFLNSHLVNIPSLLTGAPSLEGGDSFISVQPATQASVRCPAKSYIGKGRFRNRLPFEVDLRNLGRKAPNI
jgi:hypothetical protein